jgi:hypothetical protein
VTPGCILTVPGSNLAVSPAYSELPVTWAAIWDGTSLEAVLQGVTEENKYKKGFWSTKKIRKKFFFKPKNNDYIHDSTENYKLNPSFFHYLSIS